MLHITHIITVCVICNFRAFYPILIKRPKTDNTSKTGADVDALTELEDEFEVEASRRMIYCDAERDVLVMAHMLIILDGLELRMCNHHAQLHRARLNDLGAFLYELSA